MSAAGDSKRSRPGRASASTVVGVGASAGGLDAIGELLSSLSVGAPAAYVVVQHLDPDRASLLPELLARHTTMCVGQVRDGAQIACDHVYIIPPDADVVVDHGTLRLIPRHPAPGLHLPIDLLFGSIADEYGAEGIGVVLSGTGADGTKGLASIKSRGGMTFVQDPASARFSGMPESAIKAGVVVVVGTPSGIGQGIARVLATSAPGGGSIQGR